MAKSLAALKWAIMQEEWHETSILARQAQMRVWQALVEQAGGQGCGPTPFEVQQALGLQRGADLKLAELNQFIRETLE
jgi:hypothetical protein